MKKIQLILLSFITLLNCNLFAQVTFNYTGGPQNFTVPVGTTTICVNVSGARGNGNVNGNMGGGLGGRVTGTLAVVAGQVLQINVGGGGAVSNAGGYNGGGAGGIVVFNNLELPTDCATSWGGGGGGASDIRVSPYGLANRVVVGGGGGGTGGDRMVGCSPGCGGGGGGGYFGGGGGGAYGGSPGAGGTQVGGGLGGASCCGCPLAPQPGANGVSGSGGAGGNLSGGNNQADNNPGCAGGPGGAAIGGMGPNCTGGTGCPSTWAGASGGGGSNFVGALTGATSVQGVQAGNGVVIITCVVLPITLSKFEVKYQASNESVDINWATASEKNNKLFVVEKSIDAVDWKTIDTVEAAGNTRNHSEYSSLDPMPFNGVSYYRLKQIDFDGQFTYSDIQTVNIATEYLVSIFPNPTGGNLTLKYLTPNSDPVSIKITDFSLKVISNETNHAQKGLNNIEIATSQLDAGMYFIQLSNSQKTFYVKFVKE